jgi:hypothetical protein
VKAEDHRSGIRIVVGGVGRVGRDLTRLLSARPGYQIVAAYTRNPALAGQDMGVLAGSRPIGVLIQSDRDAALAEPADVLAVATTSFLKGVAADLRAGAECGLNVITTAEEAFFPWLTDEELANDLDRCAKHRGVSILGVGLNPGFIFDALLLTATGVAWDVQSIRMRRVVNISRFSKTIQRRLGIGFSATEFAAGVKAGSITGHIGFPQTFALICKCLGHQFERIDKEFVPLLAETPYVNDHLTVDVGQTAGFIQRVHGVVEGRPWIAAEFVAHVAPHSIGLDAQDVIAIDGYNPINIVINPGCNPQRGSVAMLANCIPRLIDAKPGFLTVADLALPHARQTYGEFGA